MSITAGTYTLSEKGIAFTRIRLGTDEENLHDGYRVITIGYVGGQVFEERLLTADAEAAHAAAVAAIEAEEA